MFLANTELNDGAYVFFGIIIFLVTCALIFLVYKSIKRESKKYNEEKINYIEGLQQKADLVHDINAYISRSTAAEFSLIYIDIDKFSNITNAFGKEVSDTIIEKVVYKLLEILPARIQLARLKDDKFLAFARGEYSREDVKEIAGNIVSRIAEPMKVFGESEINITASVGISFYPDHGTKYSVLLSDAEIAVYICKREGGNTYKVYTMENMSESQNLEYYHQIKNGIKNKEFCLFYQPIIDCRTKEIFAIEALLRWNHPEHGVLSPFKFMNILEQSGDINWVGTWGLESLLQEADKILKANIGKDIKFSMNLSPKQLLNPNLVSDFSKVLKRSKVPAKSVIFEVEEFAMFEKHQALKQNISDLSKLGFNIAIDSFNLDYSTLAKLENLPIDIIKVDNDFLGEDEDTYLKSKFVDMLVDYTHREQKILVTEGVEDVKMLRRALDMKLEIMQGYYFAKPMDASNLDMYVASKQWINLIDASENVDAEVKKMEDDLIDNQTEEVQESETVENPEAVKTEDVKTEDVKTEEVEEEKTVEETESEELEAESENETLDETSEEKE